VLFGDIESMAACNDVKSDDLFDLSTVMVLEICEPPQSTAPQTQKEDIKMRVIIERKISILNWCNSPMLIATILIEL